MFFSFPSVPPPPLSTLCCLCCCSCPIAHYYSGARGSLGRMRCKVRLSFSFFEFRARDRGRRPCCASRVLEVLHIYKYTGWAGRLVSALFRSRSACCVLCFTYVCTAGLTFVSLATFAFFISRDRMIWHRVPLQILNVPAYRGVTKM